MQGERPAPATVTVRVKRSNAKPEAVTDTFETDEDIPLTIPAPGLLANDVDVDGDPLTALSVTAPFGDGFTMGADGSFEYYPPPNFDSPVSFRYQVDDGLAHSDAATVQIEIHAVDDAPTAQDDEYSLGGATTLDIPAPGVLGNDFDEVEGDSLSLRHNGGPSKGTLDLRSDGSFTYVRYPGARGQDRFRYQVSDSGGAQGNIAYAFIRP